MTNGFFGRLSRKWWLMLVIGIVIGLAVGFPAGGKIMPEKLAGIAIPDVNDWNFDQKVLKSDKAVLV